LRYPTVNSQLQAIETSIDSCVQMLVKTHQSNLAVKIPLVVRRLTKTLGLVRQLQYHFPQENYSLRRCMNKDELPWNSGPRGVWRVHNRRVTKRLMEAKKSTRLV